MKIREKHTIYDRIRLLVILFILLLLVIGVLYQVRCQNTKSKTSTMEVFLHIALEPVGTTMYIWGGGWDAEDSTAGATSTRIGLSPAWKKFADKQDETYDFEEYRWEREKGLDCSGYVGWVLYNTFETEDGNAGYVMSSTDMAETYASWGFGKCIKKPKDFMPGDIVSMDGHVWISLGTCQDGSVLLVHSSPPGVMVCGTEAPESSRKSAYEQSGVESGKSIAIQLAEKFMSENYPDWYARYSNCSKPDTYLENVTIMRWNEKTLMDAKDFQKLSGEEVLEYLIGS